MGVAVSLAAGVAFGLALAAPPGPMNAVIAEESVLHGLSAGVRAGLGAMTADAVFLVATLLGVVGVVERLPTLRGAMLAAGGLLMLYFAYGAARSARAASGFDDGEAAGDAGSRGFRRAFVLALTNPYQVLFWLTVGVALLAPGQMDLLARTPLAAAGSLVVETGSPALVVGLFGGIALWIAGFPAGLVAAGRRVDRLAPAVAGVSALILAGSGVVFLADAARLLAG
ncbi:MAG: putative threonine efflux protein [uncultured archaeon A07HB70]|nr:MAG: putative threonine efflux protein [uncultured archaeon A07HB70]